MLLLVAYNSVCVCGARPHTVSSELGFQSPPADLPSALMSFEVHLFSFSVTLIKQGLLIARLVTWSGLAVALMAIIAFILITAGRGGHAGGWEKRERERER